MSPTEKSLHSSRPYLLLRRDPAHQRPNQAVHFAPLHYEPNYAYPLLVYLTGAPGEEKSLLRVMPHLSLRNYAAVAPTRPKTGWSIDSPHAEQTLEAALEQSLQRWNIAEQRVFLLGVGDGGSYALSNVLNQPGRFAGAASWNGPFPSQGNPLAHLTAVRRSSLWIGRDAAADDYPLERFERDRRLLFAAGVDCCWRDVNDAAEGASDMIIPPSILKELNVWLMDLVTASRESGR